MKLNSLFSDLIAITSYAPWDISKKEIAELDNLLGKAQELGSIYPDLSTRIIKLVLGIRDLYLDIVVEKIEKDVDTAFLFKLFNSALSATKERNTGDVFLIIIQAQKLERTIKTKKDMGPYFVKNMKYDNIYLQLVKLIKTTGELCIFLTKEKV